MRVEAASAGSEAIEQDGDAVAGQVIGPAGPAEQGGDHRQRRSRHQGRAVAPGHVDIGRLEREAADP